jgi:hypothetical protein
LDESLGTFGDYRETGYAAGLVPKAHRQQVRWIEVRNPKRLGAEIGWSSFHSTCEYLSTFPLSPLAAVLTRTSVVRRQTESSLN